MNASGATHQLTPETANPIASPNKSDLLAGMRDEDAGRSVDARITVDTLPYLPTRATAVKETSSNSLESTGKPSPSFKKFPDMADATAIVITVVARTNPTEAQQPTNQRSNFFIQPEKRVTGSTSPVSSFNSWQALFRARPIDLLLPFGHLPPVSPDVHPIHPGSTGTDIGSQSIEPGDRNDVPVGPGIPYNYEMLGSHIGDPFHPFFSVNPNSRWISASEQKICIALADFFLDVEPCEADYLFLARQVHTLPDIQFSQVEGLLRHDVFPALWTQLVAPVPEWMSIDYEWLLSVIEFRRRWKLYALLTEPFLALLWLPVRGMYFRPVLARTYQWLEKLESGEEIDLEELFGRRD